MKLRHLLLGGILLSAIGVILWGGYQLYQLDIQQKQQMAAEALDTVPPLVAPPQRIYSYFEDSTVTGINLQLINASFLHNPHRNYYGDSAPAKLDIIWKHNLGGGITRVGRDTFKWKGAGWTGQPLMVLENGQKFIIQGAYDHHLKKINAETGDLVWQCRFDDVIKGTGTLWLNPYADSLKNACLILQGSRAGTSRYSSCVTSFKAVSYFTGEKCWHLDSKRTRCYSRDVDASCLILHDTAYIGLENGIFTIFDPNPRKAQKENAFYQPRIFKNTDTLFYPTDVRIHGGNLVTEASPTQLGDRIYIASGSGHVWGYNIKTDSIDWDFFIGSDIDGTPCVTADSCLLIAVEKQYIRGNGGILKLNPAKSPSEAVEWFFPTDTIGFESWEGGVIGSATCNKHYRKASHPHFAVFTGIDGYMYVINTHQTEGQTLLFDDKTKAPKAKLIFKYATGPAISTPIVVGNKIIAATYKGTYLFEYDEDMNFQLLDKFDINCESTPFVDNGRIYLASRNGFLYCLGSKSNI